MRSIVNFMQSMNSSVWLKDYLDRSVFCWILIRKES